MAFEKIRRQRSGTRQQEHESAPRSKVHEARYSFGDERDTKGLEAGFSNTSMGEVWRDQRLREQYRNVGFHMHGKTFLSMYTKMQDLETGKEPKLTDAERNMREDVRKEFVYRVAIANACGKLLTKDVFKGVQDENHISNRLVGELGEQRALDLIRPRLVNLVGEPNGTESLLDLHQALQQLRGIYATKNYQKASVRIDRVSKRYDLTPEEYADITRGGNMFEIAGRARRQLQEGMGWVGKTLHFLPDSIRGLKVGYAGWREDHAHSIQQMRQVRSQALDIIRRVLDEDFFKAVDKEIMSGDEGKTEDTLAAKESADAKFARGMTAEDMTAKRDTAWAEYLRTHPGDNNEGTYGTWEKGDFVKAQKQEIKSHSGGWLVALVTALFDVRRKEMKKPSFT